MGDRTLPWQRLERGYYADDDIVLARRESGFIAEVFFTRFLAHGKPIRAPQDARGEVVAAALGFDSNDAPMVGLVLDWFVENGTITRIQRPGPTPKGTQRNSVFDLANREKYRPPDRFLTRNDRGSISPKAEVDRVKERDDASRDPSHDPPHTDVRTNERDEPVAPAEPDAGSDITEETLLGPEPPDHKAVTGLLAEVCDGDPETSSEWGRVRKAAKELRSLDPPPSLEEIRARATRYREKYESVELTPTALASNWSKLGPRDAEAELDRSGVYANKCPECGIFQGGHNEDCSIALGLNDKRALAEEQARSDRERWLAQHGIDGSKFPACTRYTAEGCAMFSELDAVEELERQQRARANDVGQLMNAVESDELEVGKN